MTKVQYPVRITPQEEGGFLVEGVEPLDNVLTEGDTLEEAQAMAQEALTGILKWMLDKGHPIPLPPAAEGPEVYMIGVDPEIATPITLRWARDEEGVSQAEIAARLKITQQAYQKLETSRANPSIKTLKKVAQALGRKLVVSM